MKNKYEKNATRAIGYNRTPSDKVAAAASKPCHALVTTFPIRLFCANRENVLDDSMGTMSASAEAKFLPDSISNAFARRFADDDAFADTSAEFMNSSLAPVSYTHLTLPTKA